MFLVDDLLLFPVRGILSVFEQIYAAAQEEYANQGDALRAQLGELYMMLETRRITEEEFDAQERQLLERLEQMEARSGPSGPGAQAGGRDPGLDLQ